MDLVSAGKQRSTPIEIVNVDEAIAFIDQRAGAPRPECTRPRRRIGSWLSAGDDRAKSLPTLPLVRRSSQCDRGVIPALRPLVFAVIEHQEILAIDRSNDRTLPCVVAVEALAAGS